MRATATTTDSSRARTLSKERRRLYDRERGPNGRSLCRWCGTEVQPPRRTFCSNNCVHEWRLRSDPGYLRDRVSERDKGVCAVCGRDTTALERELRELRRESYSAWRQRRKELGLGSRTRSLWDADHVVPVIEGGGDCDLSNIRTLCIPCHKRATKELRARLKTKHPREA